MAKGDKIRVDIRGGAPTLIEASQNGRKVEHEWVSESGVKFLVARESTRGGTTVKLVMVPASEVLTLTVEKRGDE